MTKPETFQQIAARVGALVEQKNRAYGSSFATAGEALRLLFPHGISPGQEDDALLIARIWDKLMRIATDRDALGENPYQDIIGYGILGVALHQRDEEQQQWPGDANSTPAQAASPAKVQLGSVLQPANAQTTTSGSAPCAQPNSPGPSASSASTSEPDSTSTASAPAPGATGVASAKEVAPGSSWNGLDCPALSGAVELNGRNCCAYCAQQMRLSLSVAPVRCGSIELVVCGWPKQCKASLIHVLGCGE